MQKRQELSNKSFDKLHLFVAYRQFCVPFWGGSEISAALRTESRLSFPATEPPDPRRVSEGFQKGFRRGLRRGLEGVSEGFSKGFRGV